MPEERGWLVLQMLVMALREKDTRGKGTEAIIRVTRQYGRAFNVTDEEVKPFFRMGILKAIESVNAKAKKEKESEGKA